LLRHWQPAAKPFLRMIATFQPYPVSVSCNCLPTLDDPAWWLRLQCCVQPAVSLFEPKANPRCVPLLGIKRRDVLWVTSFKHGRIATISVTGGEPTSLVVLFGRRLKSQYYFSTIFGRLLLR